MIAPSGGPPDYWLINTGTENEPGIDGAIKGRSDPRQTTVNTISVHSVDEYLARVIKHQGKAVTQKMPIPGTGRMAYCTDPEGNLFGIIEFTPAAR